ncbi:putative RNA-binding protein EIF1AD, partial [Lonchura striata]
MSRATKRKHVVRELLEERVQPAEGQSVVRCHPVSVTVSPCHCDFLLVDPILEGSKVKAEISLVLLPAHVRSLQRQGLWPEAFAPLERKNPRE